MITWCVLRTQPGTGARDEKRFLFSRPLGESVLF